MCDPNCNSRFHVVGGKVALASRNCALSRSTAQPVLVRKGDSAMAGLELLLMPLFTMGSMIVFAISQFRSTDRNN
jgi:hypothetical protein